MNAPKLDHCCQWLTLLCWDNCIDTSHMLAVRIAVGYATGKYLEQTTHSTRQDRLRTTLSTQWTATAVRGFPDASMLLWTGTMQEDNLLDVEFV